MRDIWIFQLEEELSESQQSEIKSEIGSYLEGWKAHGTPVPGSTETKYDRFVIVRAEPGNTSGCSIDDMTKNVTSTLQSKGLNIMEPNFVFYRNQAGKIDHFDFRSAAQLISEGKIGPETTIFNGSIQSASEFSNWEVSLEKSWLSRFLPKPV